MPATILAARDVEAFKTLVFVVLMLVLAVARELPRDVDARFVFELIAVCAAVIAEASELLAFVTSV